MDMALWDAAYGVLDTIEKLSRSAGPVADRAGLRARLREDLLAARAKFSSHLTDSEAYRALFPLVAHIDEMMQLREVADGHPSWSSLQEDLFQITDAGEVFFESIDELLESPDSRRFTLELYLVCLRLGFQGRHAGQREKLESYQRRIAKAVSEPLPRRAPPPPSAEGGPEVKRGAIARPYVAAAAVLIASCLALKALSFGAGATPAHRSHTASETQLAERSEAFR